MPTLETIKISQEINFNGLRTWVNIGGTLLPDEGVKDALRSIQKEITEYNQEEAKAYNQSKILQIEKKPESPVDSMIMAITTCTEVATLKTFEKLAKSNPKFQEAYDNRLKELTDGL